MRSAKPIRQSVRASGLALALLFVASACGVRAPPRPPGVKAALRGDDSPGCDGCEIPGPDAYPSPSSPSSSPVGGSAGLPTRAEEGETPPGAMPNEAGSQQEEEAPADEGMPMIENQEPPDASSDEAKDPSEEEPSEEEPSEEDAEPDEDPAPPGARPLPNTRP